MKGQNERSALRCAATNGNAFPGGAWDPELTEREWARVELLVRRYGCDRNALVRTIQAQVARQHQTYLATSPSSP